MDMRDWAEQELIEHGFWPHEAAAIVEMAIDHPSMTPMNGKWDLEADNHQFALRVPLWLHLRGIAYDWIMRNNRIHIAKDLIFQKGVSDGK